MGEGAKVYGHISIKSDDASSTGAIGCISFAPDMVHLNFWVMQDGYRWDLSVGFFENTIEWNGAAIELKYATFE